MYEADFAKVVTFAQCAHFMIDHLVSISALLIDRDRANALLDNVHIACLSIALLYNPYFGLKVVKLSVLAQPEN